MSSIGVLSVLAHNLVHDWLDDHVGRVGGASDLAKAMRYVLLRSRAGSPVISRAPLP